jgi:hypothetical protein
MNTNEIIKEIKRLSIPKRIYVIEKTVHSIREKENSNQMKKAADALCIDYKQDNELTIFNALDFEDFYEAR